MTMQVEMMRTVFSVQSSGPMVCKPSSDIAAVNLGGQEHRVQSAFSYRRS